MSSQSSSFKFQLVLQAESQKNDLATFVFHLCIFCDYLVAYSEDDIFNKLKSFLFNVQTRNVIEDKYKIYSLEMLSYIQFKFCT